MTFNKIIESGQSMYEKVQTQQQQGIIVLKKLPKVCRINFSLSKRKKQFKITDQLTHTDRCSSKCEVENLENFQEH